MNKPQFRPQLLDKLQFRDLEEPKIPPFFTVQRAVSYATYMVLLFSISMLSVTVIRFLESLAERQ